MYTDIPGYQRTYVKLLCREIVKDCIQSLFIDLILMVMVGVVNAAVCTL